MAYTKTIKKDEIVGVGNKVLLCNVFYPSSGAHGLAGTEIRTPRISLCLCYMREQDESGRAVMGLLP